MLSSTLLILLVYLGFGSLKCNPGCGGASAGTSCGAGSDGGNSYLGGNAGGIAMNCSPGIGGGGAGYNPYSGGNAGYNPYTGGGGGFIPGYSQPQVVPQQQPVQLVTQQQPPVQVVTQQQPPVQVVTQPPVQIVTQITPPPPVPSTKCTTQTIEECEEVPQNTPGGVVPGAGTGSPTNNTVIVPQQPPITQVMQPQQASAQVQCVSVAPQPQPVYHQPPPVAPVMTVVSGNQGLGGMPGGGNAGNMQMNCVPVSGSAGGVVRPPKPSYIGGGAGVSTGCKVSTGNGASSCYCEPPSGGAGYGYGGGNSGGAQVNCDDVSNDIKACESGNFMATTSVLGVNVPSVIPSKPTPQIDFTPTCDECVCK